MFTRLFALGVLLCALEVRDLPAQRVHRINLVQAAGNSFRFDPGRVTARGGDVLEFTVKGGGPYVVGFEPADLAPPYRDLLDAAIPDRTGPLRGPVLAGPGKSFRIVLPKLPQGSYRFGCVTHLAYRMEGQLVMR